MTRVIKFRAWDKKKGTMVTDIKKLQWWPTGLYVNSGMGSVEGNVPDENTVGSGYMRMVLMQFTGLTDKNGKEIYEGDVVEISRTITDKEAREPIREVMNWYGGQILPWPHGEEFEVIGNVWENPELLTV